MQDMNTVEISTKTIIDGLEDLSIHYDKWCNAFRGLPEQEKPEAEKIIRSTRRAMEREFRLLLCRNLTEAEYKRLQPIATGMSLNSLITGVGSRRSAPSPIRARRLRKPPASARSRSATRRA